jgi:hypothetical protein
MWNERPQGSVDYVVRMKKALNEAGFEKVGLTIEVRCAFSAEIYSRVPLRFHAFAPLEAFPCARPMAFLSDVHCLLLLPP